MLCAGILLHTAIVYFILMMYRIPRPGIWGLLVPWIVLPLGGIIAINVWTRYYRHQFGENAPRAGWSKPQSYAAQENAGPFRANSV
jgi:hypothetical protein